MARLKVLWHEPASAMFRETIDWYKTEMGRTAASRFRKGILDTVKLLIVQPEIGKRVQVPFYYLDQELRLFVEHRNHLILYYVEEDTLHVADIFVSSMKPKFVLL